MNAIQKVQPIKQLDASAIETVLLKGDLSKLTDEQRLAYYQKLCETVGLNPLTQPFQYLSLNGNLVLYARKDCTDQLRSIHGVSVEKLDHKTEDGLFVVTANVRDVKGRTDAAIGATNIENLKGEVKANAMMKAETKAKRRATLSICGLGMLDETEIDSIPNAAIPAENVANDGKVTVKCEDCKKPINAIAVSGKHFTLEQVMSNSRRHWDLDLCGDCQAKRVKASQEPANPLTLNVTQVGSDALAAAKVNAKLERERTTAEHEMGKPKKRSKQTDFNPAEFEVTDQEIAEFREILSPPLSFK